MESATTSFAQPPTEVYNPLAEFFCLAQILGIAPQVPNWKAAAGLRKRQPAYLPASGKTDSEFRETEGRLLMRGAAGEA